MAKGKEIYAHARRVAWLLILVGILWVLRPRGLGRDYAFCLVLILVSMAFFVRRYERLRPKAGDMVLLSVMCALGVVGRMVFFMVPQFKPVAALVIITGCVMGRESGFLAGAVTAFASNFFFGQGPWTPWQMMGFALVGFAAGAAFHKGARTPSPFCLCAFGGIATIILYGATVNLGTFLISGIPFSPEAVGMVFLTGIPMDLLHGASTVFFLWVMGVPMIRRLDRVRKKYGLENPATE